MNILCLWKPADGLCISELRFQKASRQGHLVVARRFNAGYSSDLYESRPVGTIEPSVIASLGVPTARNVSNPGDPAAEAAGYHRRSLWDRCNVLRGDRYHGFRASGRLPGIG